MTELIRKRELNVLLCEFLDTEAVLARPRHTDYSREVLDAVLGHCAQDLRGSVCTP